MGGGTQLLAAGAASAAPGPRGTEHPPLTSLPLSLRFPQTIPSTSPRSPFSPATIPAAASGSRTPRSPWCRWSGRCWPRSGVTAVPGSGSAAREQPQDGARTPRIAREPRNPRDGARGGHRRTGLVLPARRSPGSRRRVKSPSSPRPAGQMCREPPARRAPAPPLDLAFYVSRPNTESSLIFLFLKRKSCDLNWWGCLSPGCPVSD